MLNEIVSGIFSMLHEATVKYSGACFVFSPILLRFDKGGHVNDNIDYINNKVVTELSKTEWKNVFTINYPPFLKDDYYVDFLHLVEKGYLKIVDKIVAKFLKKKKLVLPTNHSCEEEILLSSELDQSNSDHESLSDQSMTLIWLKYEKGKGLKKDLVFQVPLHTQT